MEFWKDYLVDEGGTLHVPRSHPYEFHNGYAFKDALTEISLLKSCFALAQNIFEHSGEEDDLYAWCTMAREKLADFVEVPLDKDFVTAQKDGKAVYENPFFYGDEYKDSDRLFAIGLSERENKYISHTDTHKEVPVLNNGGYGAFCSSYTSFIFPANLVNSDSSPKWRERTNSDSKQNKIWENGRNALRTIRRIPADFSNNVFHVQYEDKLTWTGHSLELPAFARMGLTEELAKAMKYYTENFQMFPQGMFNYHHRTRWALDFSETIMENSKERRLDFTPFVQHFSFEELGIYTETIDTMLLESANNVIRLFSAYGKDAQIKLPAENGFVVEALQKASELQHIKILSKAGNNCKVRVPWDKCYLSNGGEFKEIAIDYAVVSFDTIKGGNYTLVCDINTDTTFEFDSHDARPVKNKVAIIGIPYRF